MLIMYKTFVEFAIFHLINKHAKILFCWFFKSNFFTEKLIKKYTSMRYNWKKAGKNKCVFKNLD